jgi:hypothetical protein
MARQRSHAQWRELFREQAASGLNASAFCRARGVCPKYFSLRRQQLSSGAASDDAAVTASAFAPVTLQRSIETSAVEIRSGALSLRVPMAVSPRWLVEVLHGLRD